MLSSVVVFFNLEMCGGGAVEALLIINTSQQQIVFSCLFSKELKILGS